MIEAGGAIKYKVALYNNNGNYSGSSHAFSTSASRYVYDAEANVYITTVAITKGNQSFEVLGGNRYEGIGLYVENAGETTPIHGFYFSNSKNSDSQYDLSINDGPLSGIDFDLLKLNELTNEEGVGSLKFDDANNPTRGSADLNNVTTVAVENADNPNLIVNGDFEDHSGRSTVYSDLTVDKVSGWNSSTGKIHIQEQDYGSGNAKGDAIVELRDDKTGQIFQNVDIDEAGSYTFSLNHSSRVAGGGSLTIMVDGKAVKIVDVKEGSFQTLNLDLELSAGQHEIRLIGHSANNKYQVTVDKIELRKSTGETRIETETQNAEGGAGTDTTEVDTKETTPDAVEEDNNSTIAEVQQTARISEFEHKGGDTVELALTAEAFNALIEAGGAIKYKVALYNNTRNYSGSSHTFSTSAAKYVYDAEANVYITTVAITKGNQSFEVMGGNRYEGIGLYVENAGETTPIHGFYFSNSKHSDSRYDLTINNGPMSGADFDLIKLDEQTKESGHGSLKFDDANNPTRGSADLNNVTTVAVENADNPNLIVNGDFEDHSGKKTGYSDLSTDKVSGWNSSTGKIHIQEQDYGSGNAKGDAIVELRDDKTGQIFQNVDIDEAGSYTFSLNHSSRVAGGGSLTIMVDGEAVKTVDVKEGSFQSLNLDLELSAGQHEIRLIGYGANHKYQVTVDKIELRKSIAENAEGEARIVAQEIALAAAEDNSGLVVKDGTLEFSDFKFVESATDGDQAGISDGTITGSPFGDGINFSDFSAFASGPDSRVDTTISYTVKETNPQTAIQQFGAQFNMAVDIEGETVIFGPNGPSRDLGDIEARLVHSVYAVNEDGTKGELVGSISLDVRDPDFRDPPYESDDFLLDGNYRELIVESRLVLDTNTTDAKLTLSVIGNNFDGGEAPGALSGTYFCDEDHDGVDDGAANGDLDIAGKKVELFQADGKTPVTDFDGNPVDPVLTDENGNYRFDNLKPGDYVVKFEDSEAEGKSFINKDVGNDDAIDSDADPSTGVTDPVTVYAGEETPNVDVGVENEPVDPTTPDEIEICEDKEETFNVLNNDAGEGLRLISVSHETAALQAEFEQRGGSLSFDSDGNVTYQGMTNYYGFDKLVYTVEDENGDRYTETVDITLSAASDAPEAPGGVKYHPGGWTKTYAGGDYARVYKRSDFGKFSDEADALQQFSDYNTGVVADDRDQIDSIILTGINRSNGWVVYKEERLSFENGQEHEIPIEDIDAGLLQLEFVKPYYVSHTISWRLKDTGEAGGECGSVNESTVSKTTISTPIALDLNGDNKIGVTGETSSYDKSGITELGRTVEFDIDADGEKDVIEWLSGDGDAFLFDNRDGNAINDMNGSRLFGDADGHANGYEKLAELDTDGDGMLRGDELEGLQLWADDGDAVMTEDEIILLSDVGVIAISSQMELVKDDDGRDLMQSVAELANGEQILTEDVWFMGL